LCTEVVVPAGDIAPGQEDAVVMRWTPIPGQAGLHTITCDLETNDPSKPSIRLEVSGTVNALVRIDPEGISYLDFEHIKPEEEPSRCLTVFSTKLKAFDLDVKATSPALKVAKMRLDDDSRIGKLNVKPTCAYSVIVQATKQLSPGYFRADLLITVKLPDGGRREMLIPIYGEVPNSHFRVFPAEIEFKKPSIAEEDSQPVLVQFYESATKRTLKIVAREPSFLECQEPHQVGESKGPWKFVVRIPPKNAEAMRYQPDGFFEGRIVLQASDSEALVPVRVKWNPPERQSAP